MQLIWLGMQAAPLGFDLDTWRNLVSLVMFFMPAVVGAILYWGSKYFLPRTEHASTRKETARNIRELKTSDQQVRDIAQQFVGKVDLLATTCANTDRDRAGLHEHMGRLEEQVQALTSELSRYRERMARVEERLEVRRMGDD